MNTVDEQTKTFLLEKYLRRAVDGVKHKGRGHEIKVNCPFCGDKELKGTLWLTNTYRWCYTCWRASCKCSDHGILATKWLKEVNNTLYLEYLDELKAYCKKDKKETDAMKVFIERQREDDAIKQKKKLEDDMARDRLETKNFKRIDKPGMYQQAAIDFCKKRHIPKDIWKDFFYCDEGKYRARVIIPFFDKDKKIVFFQGRTLDGSKAKYMSRVGHTALYNYDFLDKSKPVIVLEGPINSMFVDNSTATVGAGSSGDLDMQLQGLDCWYIFDNDTAGKKHAWKKVQEGKPVFLWNKFRFAYNLPEDINDINDVVCFLNHRGKFTIDQLRPYFTTYTEMYKAIELQKEKLKPIPIHNPEPEPEEEQP